MKEKPRGRGPAPAPGFPEQRVRARGVAKQKVRERNVRERAPAGSAAAAPMAPAANVRARTAPAPSAGAPIAPAPSAAARPSGARPPPGSTASTSSTPSELLYGVRAGLAVFARRRQDIRSIAYDAEQRRELAALLSWATEQRVPLHELSVRELTAQADSNQHEGLVLQVRPRLWLPPREIAATMLASRKLGVALDRVRNPQNIGAILRSAAFFGAEVALLGAPAPHPGLPPFALRVAEGAAEHISFSRTTDLADTLARLRSAGVHVVGADTHAERNAEHFQLPGATLLVLGNEREGLSPRIRAQCDTLIGIRGSGAVESLNVAVAAGVIFAELRRARSGQAVDG